VVVEVKRACEAKGIAVAGSNPNHEVTLMTEATQAYHKREAQAAADYLRGLAIGTLALARHEARKAVKHQLRAKGLKVTHIAPREINALANDYLAAHPVLIAEARARVERWTAEGVMGKRAQRALLAQGRAPSAASR
jgi:hypothetical protein